MAAMRWSALLGALLGPLVMGAGVAHADWNAFHGFVPIAADDTASDADKQRLRAAPGTHLDGLDCGDGTDAVLALHGKELTALYSFADGLAVFDSAGKLLGRGEPIECQGSNAGLAGLALGQVVSDAAPEVVVAYANGGRMDWYSSVAIYKQSPKGAFQVIADVATEDHLNKGETTRRGQLELAAPDRLLVKDTGKKKAETWSWDAAAFKFHAGAPAPAAAPLIPFGPVGKPTNHPVAIPSVTATSTYADKRDGYAAWRVLAPTTNYEETDDGGADAILASAWCEGKPDEGLGEGITVTFAQPTRIDSIDVLPGVQKSDALFAANNFPTALRLTTTDGRSVSVSTQPTRAVSTEIPVGGAAVSGFTVSIVSVKKGRMNDTCISRISLDVDRHGLEPLLGLDQAALDALPLSARALSDAINRCDAAALAGAIDLPLRAVISSPAPGGQHTFRTRALATVKEVCKLKPALSSPGDPWMAVSAGPGKVTYEITNAGGERYTLAWRGGAWHLAAVEVSDSM
jgi:hypothetical protein